MPDIGSGNFASVCHALEYLGVEVVAVREPGQLERVSHVVLPGVGAFPAAMTRLMELGGFAVCAVHCGPCRRELLLT